MKTAKPVTVSCLRTPLLEPAISWLEWKQMLRSLMDGGSEQFGDDVPVVLTTVYYRRTEGSGGIVASIQAIPHQDLTSMVDNEHS